MPKFLRDTGLIFSAILLFATIVLAEEEITITTYYPSPYGSYNQIETNTLGVGDNNNNGNLDSGDVPDPTANPGGAWIKGNVGIGTTSPGAKLDVVGGNVRTSGTILVPQSSAPVSPVEGQIYYDSTFKTIRMFSGSIWKNITASEKLVFDQHSISQCTASGGVVVNVGSDVFCRFNAANCLAGWTQYLYYSTTVATINAPGCSWEPCCRLCTTGSHSWSNADIETCGFRRGNCEYGTAYATRTQIGCY